VPGTFLTADFSPLQACATCLIHNYPVRANTMTVNKTAEHDIAQAFLDFVKVVKALRTPETGCPWDLEQDHKSLRPYLIEESYEVLQAIDAGDDAELCDELGDVLLQAVLHGQVAADRGAFSILEITRGVMDKMIRRHPHVFGDTKVKDSAEVLKNWEEIKSEEKGAESKSESRADRLARIPAELPSLLRAQRLGEKAAKVRFDWSNLEGVLEKVHEEMGELLDEIKDLPELEIERGAPGRALKVLSEEKKAALEHEFGDVLFSLTQLARWLGISAEDSLRTCSDRFVSRFRALEELCGERFDSMGEAELEAAWQEIKKAK